MTEIAGFQKKFLRGLAHNLNPVVMVGKGGVTATVLAAVREALDHHELIKVKIAGDREERRTAAAGLAEGTGSVLAGLVGGVAILYRQHPDSEKRVVTLPARPNPSGTR